MLIFVEFDKTAKCVFKIERRNFKNTAIMTVFFYVNDFLQVRLLKSQTQSDISEMFSIGYDYDKFTVAKCSLCCFRNNLSIPEWPEMPSTVGSM